MLAPAMQSISSGLAGHGGNYQEMRVGDAAMIDASCRPMAACDTYYFRTRAAIPLDARYRAFCAAHAIRRFSLRHFRSWKPAIAIFSAAVDHFFIAAVSSAAPRTLIMSKRAALYARHIGCKYPISARSTRFASARAIFDYFRRAMRKSRDRVGRAISRNFTAIIMIYSSPPTFAI